MTDPNSHLYAVIMAGGSGTRFWPASRAERPKQFLPITGGRPMIRETFERIEGLVPPERVLVVTAAGQVDLVREALPELDPGNILAEPEARNTAAAIGLASSELARRDPKSIQAVLAADHSIEPAQSFRDSLSAAVTHASQADALLVFGIVPTHPATGYGYIKVDGQIGSTRDIPVFAVDKFVEKPDARRAAEFIQDKAFYWNSGMFVWTTKSILAAIAEHAPELRKGLAKLGKGKPIEEVYAKLPALPIDVAVLERAKNVRMMPIDFTWNDVGSWSALPDIAESDAQGNVLALSGGAELVSIDAKNCIAYAEGEQVVALIGVEDLVVVHAGGATLVCPRDRAQEVKAIVDELRTRGSKFL